MTKTAKITVTDMLILLPDVMQSENENFHYIGHIPCFEILANIFKTNCKLTILYRTLT